MNEFERHVRELTSEINGQYPRPWMTDMKNPLTAKVFVVGYNPAHAYPTGSVNYERHIDALFNRNGESCRDFYAEVTKQSPSRGNIEMLTGKLASCEVFEVVETNVVCYATRRKADLGKLEHVGGRERGIAIFRALMHMIRPRAIVVHGKGVCDELSRALDLTPPLPPPPERADRFVDIDLPGRTRIFVVPSLALPGYRN